jgi:hypothetical protein
MAQVSEAKRLRRYFLCAVSMILFSRFSHLMNSLFSYTFSCGLQGAIRVFDDMKLMIGADC